MYPTSVMEKPMTHYTWEQWERANKNMEKITQMRNYVSNHVRQLAEQIRNSTHNTVGWQLKETNNRMADRISEVEQWYKNLERTLEDLKDQTQRLSNAKIAMESTFMDLLPLKEVAEEVITLRDRRREIDLVEDEPYREVHKERNLIQTVELLLRGLTQDAFSTLLKLKEQRDKLVADLKRKAKALDIDNYKISLTPNSVANISYKPFPLDVPDGSVDPETWLKNCTTLKKDTENLLTRAMQMTNDMWGILKTKLDDIKKQREVTERALRKRMHETVQMRDRLGVQRKQLMDEINKLDKEMKDIEKEIAEVCKHMKLVQTRFENRKWRQGMEQCRDVTQDSLKKEFDHISKSKDILEQHLRDVKNTLNGLRHQLHRVEDDLERKERSLALENACLQAHQRVPKPPYQQPLSWRAPATTLEFTGRVNAQCQNDRNTAAGVCPQVADASTMVIPSDVCKEHLLVE